MICKECKQPLTKSTFHDGDVYVCLNWECPLFRERQVIVAKKRETSYVHIHGRYKSEHTYKMKLAKRSKNYHRLREFGFDVSFSKRFRNDKQTARISELVERGLSKEFIIAALTGDGLEVK